MSLKHPHIWKFFPEPTYDQQEFMRLTGLLGEREGGPMRIKSTPREGVNPYWDRFVENSSDDFRACLTAGVAMEVTSKKTSSGVTITMGTKNPVAVHRVAGRTFVVEGRTDVQ